MESPLVPLSTLCRKNYLDQVVNNSELQLTALLSLPIGGTYLWVP